MSNETDALRYNGKVTVIVKRPDASRGVMSRFKLERAVAEERIAETEERFIVTNKQVNKRGARR